MKKIALYSPYFPKHSGGGERYFLSIAETLSQENSVFILVPTKDVEKSQHSLARYEKLFGLDLSKVQITASTLPTGTSLDRIKETATYDGLFAMTDGSFFPTLAKRSYLIVQVPWTRALSLSERIKLTTWTSILVYSDFVASVLTKSWKTTKIKTLSPYVDLNDFQPDEKEKLILNVGRFFSHSQSNSKRQDILVEAFQRLMDHKHFKGYQLALVGNVDPNPDSVEFVAKLKKMSAGYPISIHTDISYDELRAFNSRARIYWHAAGFGVNDTIHPENTEHFGITTLEAMASGAIPLVVPKGGQAEIVTNPNLWWQTIDELVYKTSQVLLKTDNEREELGRTQRKLAQVYAKEKFETKVKELL